jgi:hypothetical protein
MSTGVGRMAIEGGKHNAGQGDKHVKPKFHAARPAGQTRTGSCPDLYFTPPRISETLAGFAPLEHAR